MAIYHFVFRFIVQKYTTSVVLLSSPFLAVSPLCRRSSFSDRNIGISCGIAVIHFSFNLGGKSSSPGWKVIIISFSKFFLQFVSTGWIGGMYKPLWGPVCGGIPWKEGAENRAWQIDWGCGRLFATLFLLSFKGFGGCCRCGSAFSSVHYFLNLFV